ncbi:sugar phosphate isomerase/epimerase family protein [Glutamicibacter sp. NPDC087344]|uniref:sugar phosphate isomerase/epimerase family protein n=1 Tax=Glutamicibacter sp. NPDC087344 TaxID=3363994 RepID=UPI0038211045
MNTETQELGLAQLSLLNCTPADLLYLAADTGFDFIGARVRPVTAEEKPYNLQPGSPLLAQTLAAVKNTGLRIHDIEFILLDGGDQREHWLPMLDAGGALNARTLTVAASDRNLDRLGENLARLTEDAKNFGIMPTLEVISYQSVNSLELAAELAQGTGCQIVADTLHLSRIQASPAQLAAHAEHVAMLQLCDASARRPETREQLVFESRSERMVPGQGAAHLAEFVAALPAQVPLSVETPSDSTVARLGARRWAEELKAGAEQVLIQARTLRAAAV